MRIILLWMLLNADALGPALRQDGYSIRPPNAFHLARMDLLHGTRVAAIAPKGVGTGYLSAALTDADNDNPATVLISIIDGEFPSGPGSRDTLATAVSKHFQDDLELKFALMTAQSVADRLEVEGTVGDGSQLRHILVATWPAADRHVVVTASIPEVRWAALKPLLHESLDTLRFEPSGAAVPKGAVWAVAALTAALFMFSVGLWRRRQRTRRGG